MIVFCLMTKHLNQLLDPQSGCKKLQTTLCEGGEENELTECHFQQ